MLLAEEYKSNIVLDKTVQKVLDREREYLENMLIKEKKENTMKDGVIENLKRDIENLAK